MLVFHGLAGVQYIKGWRELRGYTQMTDNLLRRAIGLYDFPKPLKIRQQSNLWCTWDRDAVETWLREKGEAFEANYLG